MTHDPRRRALLLALLAGAASSARSQAVSPREVMANLADARLQGSGTLRFLGLHVYDARLWVGPRFDPADPAANGLALELEYAREFKGARIAERSLAEMQRGEPFSDAEGERWLAAMRRLFPDVRPGDRICAVNRPGDGLGFFLNAAEIGALREPAFARRFLAIWLGPQTSEPGLRRQLLGRSG